MFELLGGLFKAIGEDIKDWNMSRYNKKLDKNIFKGTKWEGKKFHMESGWDDFDSTYASPVFRFNNGERVVFDRQGNIVVL